MSAPFPAPEGFGVERAGRTVLYLRDGWREQLLAAGLGEPERWEAALRASPAATGRGPVGRITLPDDRRVLLKRMRRGGLAGPLWRGRYLGVSRLRANLVAPAAARRRGVATPEAAAMLVVEGPPRLFRAWLAVEEIEGAADLHVWLLRSPSPHEVEEVLGAIRRAHDVGLHHADLNLGNVLVRRAGSRSLEVFLVDLDRARFYEGGVPFRLRQAALRRLERSFAKRFGSGSPHGVPEPEDWYRLYARGNASLARRLGVKSWPNT